MANRERKQKNDPRNYQADLLGNQLEQQPQSPRNRRGKNGTVHINGMSFVQDALFKGEEIRVPFPTEPVNKIPDRLGTTGEPGTLFATPTSEPQSTQATLFTEAVSDAGETSQSGNDQQREPGRRQAPPKEPRTTRRESSLHAPDLLKKQREADIKQLFACIEKISRKTNHDLYDSFNKFLDVSIEATRRAMLFDIHWQPELGEFEEAREEFYKGYAVLMSNYYPDYTYQDIIGSVYMQFAYHGQGSSIFFTPWNVARMMAEMTLKDANLEKFTPERPMTICDPACGSGILLLAAASVLPREFIDQGRVAFFGVDINPTCVKMVRLNMMIYGLYRPMSFFKPTQELTREEIAMFPEPYQQQIYQTLLMEQQEIPTQSEL